MSDDASTPPRTRMRPVDPRLLRYASASRGFFVVLAAIGLAQTAVIAAVAWLLTQALTRAIDGAAWGDLAGVLVPLLVVIGLRGALIWAREVVCARAGAKVEAQLRTRFVAAVSDLGPGWLESRNTARLALVAGRGLEALDPYFSRYLPQLVLTVIATPVLIAIMWWQDWISGLTVILTIPLIPVFMVLIGLATRAVQNTQWKTLGRLAARFADTIRGLSTLKVYGRQYRAVSSIETVTNSYRRETLRVLRVSFVSGFALELLASISVAVIAVSIGFRLVDGSLALAVGLFVLLLAPEAYLPLRQVGVQFHAAAEGVAATEDVFAVLDAAAGKTRATPPHDASATPTAELRSEPSVVRLEQVRVKRGDVLLPPLSFTATPGTVTLLEGPSGSGKSSVLAALRGAAVFEGHAEVAGRDVRTISPKHWLAWAGQQPGLIAGTIEANVRLGDDADHADADTAIGRALELAQAEALDPAQELGVQGAGLSGGQAQRIAIARAFYRYLCGRAQVIVLDEPTAALDPDTEAAVWCSVRELADAGATILIVSHRRTARDIADQVVTLEPREVSV